MVGICGLSRQHSSLRGTFLPPSLQVVLVMVPIIGPHSAMPTTLLYHTPWRSALDLSWDNQHLFPKKNLNLKQRFTKPLVIWRQPPMDPVHMFLMLNVECPHVSWFLSFLPAGCSANPLNLYVTQYPSNKFLHYLSQRVSLHSCKERILAESNSLLVLWLILQPLTTKLP